MNTYIENLNWRYATKQFDSTKKLSAEQLDMLCEALRLAPSSFGLQPWKFYCITDEAVRNQMREMSYGQSQVTDASALFVICGRVGMNEGDVEKYVADIAQTRGVSLESLAEYKSMMIGSVNSKNEQERDSWCARQAYIALGFLLSCAAQHHIDACPMEGFDAAAVTKLIGADADGYVAYAYCTVGYRSEEDKYAHAKKVRFPIDQVVKKI
jgi:nitroreductase